MRDEIRLIEHIQMSDKELSLLIFFETCLVDKRGRVNIAHMNTEDMEIAKKWTKEKFVLFGEVSVKDVFISGFDTYSHWVRFSDKAWTLAHLEREARSRRMLKEADYKRLLNGKVIK
jgi:hypothetical protein